MSEEIDSIIHTESLKDAPARKFISECFRNGYVETSGTDIANIMPPMNPFKKAAGREEKKRTVIDKIRTLFEKFYDLIGTEETSSTTPIIYDMHNEEQSLDMAAEDFT